MPHTHGLREPCRHRFGKLLGVQTGLTVRVKSTLCVTEYQAWVGEAGHELEPLGLVQTFALCGPQEYMAEKCFMNMKIPTASSLTHGVAGR